MMGFILFYFNVNVWWYFAYFYHTVIYLDPPGGKDISIIRNFKKAANELHMVLNIQSQFSVSNTF